MEEIFFMWLLSWRRIFFHLAYRVWYRADGESYKDRVATIPWGRKGPPNILYYINPGNMETLITILPCPSNWRNVACLRLHRLFRSPWNPRWPMNSPSSYYRQFLGLPYSMTSLSDCVDFERTLDLENSKEKKILICLKKRTAVDQIMDEKWECSAPQWAKIEKNSAKNKVLTSGPLFFEKKKF